MTSSVGPVDSTAIGAQLGASYDRFDATDRARHVEMLHSIRRPEDVALHAEFGDDKHWTVTVCTSDWLGALSIIAGLFTAYRFDILSADVATLRFEEPRQGARTATRSRRRLRRSRLPRSRQPVRRILDVFEVRGADDTDPSVWQRFRDELAGLVVLLAEGRRDEARDWIIERVSESARAVGDTAVQMFPISIELTNEASPAYTELTIRSADTLGFLFTFTNALAVLNANIERAEIRTIHGEVHDTFWLTDPGGHKILKEERIHELRVAAALIKHFTHLLPHSPNPAQALRQFNAMTHQMLSRPDWTKDLRDMESRAVLETLAELMGVSQFLWEDFLRMQHENLFPVLLDMPALDEHKSKEQLRESLERELCSLTEQADQVSQLNGFKDREMFRIDLRHITGRIGLRDFSEELSDLAEVAVGEAAQLSHNEFRQRFGDPTLADGRRCQWCICALGKFGGRELGFGSDVELIVVYEAEGVTDGPTVVENALYFDNFVRTLLTTLTAPREGIFEIDLRLRPYGNKGPLASSLGAFRDYYSEGGAARQFERMALVKLRPVAGDPELSDRVVEARDDFVYSGAPLDVENILHLRSRQEAELVPPGAISAKYSPGGLVDVEYFMQACQIAVGHLDPCVRVRGTLDAIDRLEQGSHLSSERAEELRETYGFLRRLIDALRVVRGHAKDLTIPATDSREFAYLARRLQYDSTAHLYHAITKRMGSARRVWHDGVPAVP